MAVIINYMYHISQIKINLHMYMYISSVHMYVD